MLMVFSAIFLVVVAVVVGVIAATAATRSVLRVLDLNALATRPVEPPIETRLARIEEAIDAMAQQIERLTEQQRQLLGGASPLPDDADDVPR